MTSVSDLVTFLYATIASTPMFALVLLALVFMMWRRQ